MKIINMNNGIVLIKKIAAREVYSAEVNIRFFTKGPNCETKSTPITQLILDDDVHKAL